MILLHGYYGERNAGDDAFTTICAERFSPQHGPVRVMASTLPQSAAPFATPILLKRRWKGLAARVEHRRIHSLLRRGANVILGGGSLLRTSAGIAEVHALVDASPNGRHAALGISVGPWRDAGAEATCAALLPRFAFVGVRDQRSLERCRMIAPTANVELTFDLAPLLRLGPLSSSRAEGHLGIALCGPAVSEAALTHLAGVLETWLGGARHRRIVLLPFNVHPRKGDIALHKALARLLGHPSQVLLEPYSGDPRTMWKRIAELQAIVAMRLHAGIFGYSSSTPTLLVPYEEKCHEWARMIDHPAEAVRAVDALTVRDLDQLMTTPLMPGLPVATARAMASRNFEAIGA